LGFGDIKFANVFLFKSSKIKGFCKWLMRARLENEHAPITC